MGMVGLVRPRSGLAARDGIDVMAGVIDADFRGEVRAVLINHGAAGTGPVRSQLTTVMPYFTETADKLGPI